MSNNEIETPNAQAVGMTRGGICVMVPKTWMTKNEALIHAAWLVALADDSEDQAKFNRYLNAVLAI